MRKREETNFIVNEFLEGPQEELKRIVKIATRKPKPYDRKVAFLKEFTYGLLSAYRLERFKELERVKEIKKVEIEKKEVKAVKKEVKKPVVKEVKLDLPPPPKPKLEVSRDIIVGSNGMVFAKAVFKNNIYNLDEPKLDKGMADILDLLKKRIGEKVLKKRRLLDDKEYLRKNILKASKGLRIPYKDESFDNIRYYFIRDLVNFGRVEGLIKDSLVSEIICDGAGRDVVVNYKGNEVGTNVVFSSDDEINKVVMNLADKAGKKVSQEHPFLNVVIGNLKIQANIKSGFSGAKFIIRKI